MTISALVLSLFFALLTGFLGMVVWRLRGAKGTTTLLVTPVGNLDHRSLPHLVAAAAISLIQTVSLGAAAAYPALATSGYLLVVTLSGLFLISLLIFLAHRSSTNQ